MIEIERKILGINKRALLAKIAKLKPKPRKLFDGLMRVRYFDFVDGRIHRAHDLLRVRELVQRRGGLNKRGLNKRGSCKRRTEVVYKVCKGIKKGCKIFEELEFEASCGDNVKADAQNFEQVGKFLKQLGLGQTVYYEKRRTLFAYKNLKFEIDEHPRIPAFLEIEGQSPAAIDKAVRLLGLQDHEQSALSIGGLLKEKYPKIRLNGLKF